MTCEHLIPRIVVAGLWVYEYGNNMMFVGVMLSPHNANDTHHPFHIVPPRMVMSRSDSVVYKR